MPDSRDRPQLLAGGVGSPEVAEDGAQQGNQRGHGDLQRRADGGSLADQSDREQAAATPRRVELAAARRIVVKVARY